MRSPAVAAPWRTGRRTDVLALLLGAASVPGFAPFHAFPLPFITLALLFALWRPEGITPRRAAWLGWLWGCGFFLGGVSWIYISLHDVGGMPLPLAGGATLLFCATLALYPALAGGLFVRWQSGDAVRDAWLAAGLWTLAEWLRGWLLTGFPWLSIGYSQTPPSPLSGYAAILGVYGIGLAVALLAALAAFAGRRTTLLACALVGTTGFLLQHMAWTHPDGPPLTVSLVQGNIGQSGKWDRERVPHSLHTYADLVRRHPAQLVILPETALPMLLEDIPDEYLAGLTAHSPIIAGVAISLIDQSTDRRAGYANAAVLLSNDTPHTPRQVYAKSHLVPFGEFVPPGFSWFLDLIDMPMSDFTPGPPRQATLDIAGQKIAPNICYEDLFGEEIVRALPHATLLANLSNTAWFGDSLAQPQHLQIARMRAMETGRDMLRATNTGMTAVIHPDGNVAAALPAFTADALTVEVQGRSGMTPYARWGNLPIVLLALAALLPAAAWRRGRREAQRT